MCWRHLMFKFGFKYTIYMTVRIGLGSTEKDILLLLCWHVSTWSLNGTRWLLYSNHSVDRCHEVMCSIGLLHLDVTPKSKVSCCLFSYLFQVTRTFCVLLSWQMKKEEGRQVPGSFGLGNSVLSLVLIAHWYKGRTEADQDHFATCFLLESFYGPLLLHLVSVWNTTQVHVVEAARPSVYMYEGSVFRH